MMARMRAPRPVTRPAEISMDKLASILQTGTPDDVAKWITDHSWHDRGRDTGVVIKLAEAAAQTVTFDPTADFYRPDPDDGATRAGRMASQLVTAHLNDDDTFDALVRAWVSWPPPARADVPRELLGAIVHPNQ